ncbi:MAG TPA: protein kinase [Pyrinomonadaceae bacterium]|nr:protein kinase [Pyrinomonadaceae bacterium]
MPLGPGTRFGRYEISSLLGAGGMGEVYLARDTTELERLAAVKVLPAELATDPERMRRFVLEAKTASSLNHPNILTVYEIGEADSSKFIATEYVEGETLRRKMARSRLTLREALDVAVQVASALAAAHKAGVAHRDIKPENVMVRGDGIVKVLDFGIAKLAERRAQTADTEAPTRALVNTGPGVVMGTVSYMSPEQARGLSVDERTDIWSLGVMLYEMVAGRSPFEGETATDVLANILHHEPKSLLLYRSDVPDELERSVEKALAKDREERYQVVKDMALDLKRLRQRFDVEAELERSVAPVRSDEERAAKTEQFAAERTDGSIHTTSSAEYIVNEIKRHKRGALVALAALVAVAGVVAYFAYTRSSAGGKDAGVRAVAVLPFTNVGGDPETEYLSDGISEALINSLSRLPQLKVIARSSSFRYKGKEVNVQEAAQALGVQALVMGRVSRRGDQLQVSVEMVNAADGTQMWGEQYSRKASDVQAVQDEIARAISENLRLRLTGAEEQQLAKHATNNPRAYELYLNALFYMRKVGFEDVKKALAFLTEATTLDPNFGLAYAAIADSQSFLAINSVVDAREALARGKAAAQRALEIDETLAEAHAAMGVIKLYGWDWSGAEAELKRAIELNPNLAIAHFRYSQYLTVMGRFDEALAAVKRAQELDPLRLSPRAQAAAILYFARRYDEAVQQLQKAQEMDPNHFLAHGYLGYTYTAQGKYAEAISEYQKTAAIVGENASLQCYLGYALAKSGRRAEALAILDKLKTTKEYVSPAELAIIYVGLGDKEEAFQALERAYAAHDLQLQYLNVDPHFDTWRSDPRFADLVRRVGLPQ